MKYEEFKNDFKEQIIRTLTDFSNTEQNKNVYAIVFDCDLSVGQVVLRYSNLEVFEGLKKDWKKYGYMYKPYGQNGLFGLKYNSVGDFPMLRYEYNGVAKHFMESYYYYQMDSYFGEGEPIDVIEMNGQILREDNLREELKNIFIKMIIDTIHEVKDMPKIINYDNDYLIFMCDHDYSNADLEKWVRQTNDNKLVDKLAQIMD